MSEEHNHSGAEQEGSPAAVTAEEHNHSGLMTPTTSDHVIPAARSCPPPRRKKENPHVGKRRKVDHETTSFFEAMNREEVESFFRSVGSTSSTDPSGYATDKGSVVINQDDEGESSGSSNKPRRRRIRRRRRHSF
ncbi:hypothetical protein LINPERHAP1_LOCUS33653 [Linum perenne]